MYLNIWTFEYVCHTVQHIEEKEEVGKCSLCKKRRLADIRVAHPPAQTAHPPSKKKN